MVKEIIRRVLQGDVRTTASLIRDIDDGISGTQEILKGLFPHTGRAFVIGITGPPGVGKSTLIDCLIGHLRSLGKTVGVLAVDPTSTFGGGAILGDRIRMKRHTTDDAVFIRSLATRGQFGGITISTRGAIMVLDAMGKDLILVETVGVGQDEIDIARVANTTIVITAPDMGDNIQAVKAGLLEVADIYAVNKSDKAGADKAVQELKSICVTPKDNDRDQPIWVPPVIKTEAVYGKGVEKLWEAAQKHRHFTLNDHSPHGRQRMRFNHKLELIELVKQKLISSLLKTLDESGELDGYVDDIMARTSDPFSISDLIVDKLKH